MPQILFSLKDILLKQIQGTKEIDILSIIEGYTKAPISLDTRLITEII